jgi:peptidyl-prolyl cis-trans isomerase A (cyclophilin A)
MRLSVLFATLLTMALPAAAWSGQPRHVVRVAIESEAGRIEVEIDRAAAPRTAENFLRYVDDKAYDGASFYRVVTLDNQPNNLVKVEVIQGGVDGTRPTREPIALERTSVTGVTHRDGTISMARNGPDTATSEFFICVGDQPELDFGGRRNPDGQGFAAFGRVVSGMDVVRKIQRSPVQLQRLTPPVTIVSIRRLSQD